MAKSSKPGKSGKSGKAAKSERQQRIDAALKRQRGAEKRRGYAIVGVAVVVAVGIVVAAAYRPVVNAFESSQYESLAVEEVGAPASTCQDIETKQASGVSNHVPQGQQVTYEETPPAYGPHWNVAGVAPAPFTNKFYDAEDRPELEALVHNLEHGYTILWYDETVAADDEQMTQIRSIAKKFKSEDQNFRLKFVAAPWTSEDSGSFPEGQHVAFTHWKGDAQKSTGVWQYCSQVSGAALDEFMTEYPYTDSPEPGAM